MAYLLFLITLTILVAFIVAYIAMKRKEYYMMNVLRRGILMAGMIVPIIIAIFWIGYLCSTVEKDEMVALILLLLLVLIPCSWCFVVCYDLYPKKAKIIKGQKYILYLRAFDTDNVGGFSQYLDLLKQICPVIAIGDPTKIGTKLNNVQFVYTEENKWKNYVTTLIDGSYLNVINLSNTDGLYWEISSMLSQREKFLIVAQTDSSFYSMKMHFKDDSFYDKLINLNEFPAIIWYREKYGFQYRVGSDIHQLIWWYLVCEHFPKYGMGELKSFISKVTILHKPYNYTTIEYQKDYIKQFKEGGLNSIFADSYIFHKILLGLCPYLFIPLFSMRRLTGKWGLYIVFSYLQFWSFLSITIYMFGNTLRYEWFFGYIIHILIYFPIHYRFYKNGLGLLWLIYGYHTTGVQKILFWSKLFIIIIIVAAIALFFTIID